jgi:hypothetical protein
MKEEKVIVRGVSLIFSTKWLGDKGESPRRGWAPSVIALNSNRKTWKDDMHDSWLWRIYDFIYERFHTRCINMYIFLNRIGHMYTVTTGCMLRYAYMHVLHLRFQTHVYGCGWVTMFSGFMLRHAYIFVCLPEVLEYMYICVAKTGKQQ